MLNCRSLSNSVPDNLWDNLDSVAKDSLQFSLNKIMNPWINQHGYPLVTVTVDKKYATFEQVSHFLISNIYLNQQPIEIYYKHFFFNFLVIEKVLPRPRRKERNHRKMVHSY